MCRVSPLRLGMCTMQQAPTADREKSTCLTAHKKNGPRDRHTRHASGRDSIYCDQVRALLTSPVSFHRALKTHSFASSQLPGEAPAGAFFWWGDLAGFAVMVGPR